ncbi:hypothetical protein TWF694_008982 [Orbilia ellipsospora]|uniref:Uncharacterized protein n=1 Tax=Orbilia ellipsospora TaxID=2528407 RepID=A0AAV9XER6_9PEZI
MSYNVYRVEFTISLLDPEVPPPRYHNVIFVETGTDGSGVIHNVAGDMVAGMKYETENSPKPEDSITYHAKYFLGTVSTSGYPANIDGVLEGVPAPTPQKSFNLATMATEQHKSPGVFYAPGEPRPPLYKCTEWTINHAIPALIEAGVLHA